MSENVLIIYDQIFRILAGDGGELLQSPTDDLSIHILVVWVM